jgi:hypothetical protein
VGQGAPLLAALFAFLALGRTRVPRAGSRGDAEGRARELLQHWTYGDAQGRNVELRGWLAERLGLPSLVGAPAEGVVGAVREHGASEEEAEELARLLASLDETRYGRSGGIALDGDAGRSLIESLHRRLPHPAPSAENVERGRKRLRAAGYGTVVLGLACVGWVVLAPGPAEGSPEFAAGLEALRSGDARLAAANFAGYVRARPEDAAGWYNLGLAEAAAGRTGHAVWAWLNALRRAPGDDDAAGNARALGAQEVAVTRARGRPPASAPWLTTGATVVLYLMALCGLVAAASPAPRRWRIAASAAGAAAIVLLGASQLRERSSRLVVPLEPVALRYEPVRAGEAGQTLEPGAALVPRERRGSWVRVDVVRPGPDPLREGWIEAGAIAPVNASALP